MHKWSYSLQNKTEIRKTYLNKRRTITKQQRAAAGVAAKQLFLNSQLLYMSQHIACYLAQDYEFDCGPIIQEIHHLGKNCYLPILSAQDTPYLEFAPYRVEDPLHLNRYKIAEPEGVDRFAIENLDIVIVPLVAFDQEGNRIGMGGGYYDRTFAFKHEKSVSRPFLLGLAYEMQKTISLPSQSWDVRLDGVLTENRLYLLS